MTDMINELQAQVKEAIATNTPLSIVGGNSKQHLGRQVVGKELHVAAHQGVISYSPTELVLRVRSGTTISAINELLAEHNQRLPFAPPNYQDKATIGGTLAANQSGLATPWYGGVRDSVLGLGLINGKGEHMHFGGQVMKNVAGFDVSRTQVGAMGSLGLITEVSLKVWPEFSAQKTLVMTMPVAEALSYMSRFFRETLPVTGVVYWQGQVYVRLQGEPATLEEAAVKLGGDELAAEAAGQFWTSVREQTLLQPQADEVLWRTNVAPNEGHTMIAEDCLLNWAGAQRWQCLKQGEPGPQGAVQYSGGDRQLEVNGELDKTAMGIQKNLKAAFDPQGIFNPGRLYSWM